MAKGELQTGYNPNADTTGETFGGWEDTIRAAEKLAVAATNLGRIEKLQFAEGLMLSDVTATKATVVPKNLQAVI